MKRFFLGSILIWFGFGNIQVIISGIMNLMNNNAKWSESAELFKTQIFVLNWQEKGISIDIRLFLLLEENVDIGGEKILV